MTFDLDAARDQANLTPVRQLGACISAACDEIATLRARLPAGMEHCTILFKECEKGHGWLTATNWVQHGCETCERDKLRAHLRAVLPMCRRWWDGMSEHELSAVAAAEEAVK